MNIKWVVLGLFSVFAIYLIANQIESKNTNNEAINMKYNSLTIEEEKVIIGKGTERPFSGKYDDFYEAGQYHCKRCDAPLYKSDDKFNGHCGWPSFDDEIPGSVKRIPDSDGRRIEIVCANCGAHLGHIFKGEGMTPKNTRHCVNSISLKFKPLKKEDIKEQSASAYFAGGCFWGVEYHFEKLQGVKDAISGYMGGNVKNPGYYDVAEGNTEHLETVKVEYDPSIVSFEDLAKLFFEIHDPTQTNGQGPDIGSQYLSAIFYNNNKEKQTAQKLIDILKSKGLNIATKLIPTKDFFKAEEYHQNYYKKTKKTPYCHRYTKRK